MNPSHTKKEMKKIEYVFIIINTRATASKLPLTIFENAVQSYPNGKFVLSTAIS